jgi:iron-sulfur cluster assembly protein
MLSITQRAEEAVKALLDEADAAITGLRVMVKAGGCSGFQYDMTLEDAPAEEDILLEFTGARLLVDPQSLELLSGVTLDYVESPTGAGFRFVNPAATSTCGCGKSFSMDMGEALEAGEGCGSRAGL